MITEQDRLDRYGEVHYGYRHDLENHAGIIQYGCPQYAAFREAFKEYSWEPPEEIDPRDWFDIEDQQQSNSCVGNSGADSGEFCNLLADGSEIQLSRYFSYLAAQEAGGMLGRDSGAYLEAMTKAAGRGIPLESRFEWSTAYNSQLRKYNSEKQAILAGDVWKYPGATPLPTAEDAYRWLSGWCGSIQIGIGWSLGNQWEVTSYRAGGGGHALLICGYLKVAKWPMGIGFLLKNSWNTTWGRDGWALISPTAYDQMFRSRGNVAIGRSDMVSPRPRVESVDFWRSRQKQGSGRLALAA